jgi:hypothetical protein
MSTPSPSGASDFRGLTVSPKRYPEAKLDRKLEFFSNLFRRWRGASDSDSESLYLFDVCRFVSLSS